MNSMQKKFVVCFYNQSGNVSLDGCIFKHFLNEFFNSTLIFGIILFTLLFTLILHSHFYENQLYNFTRIFHFPLILCTTNVVYKLLNVVTKNTTTPIIFWNYTCQY